MGNVTALLNTSVADAKSSLECQLMSNPAQAIKDSKACLDAICSDEHQRSRRAMLNTIINKARKQQSKKMEEV